jgi:hypothetical protein
MKSGQDVMKNPCGSSIAGFNMCQDGHSYNDAFEYPHQYRDGARLGGWKLAEKMIKEGKIFFTLNFHKSHSDCDGHAFQYGGFWVCNTCGGNRCFKPWWNIKVFKDGNAWCCIGEDFKDLQSSENYAFGDTRDEAISNYGDTIVSNMAKESIKYDEYVKAGDRKFRY